MTREEAIKIIDCYDIGFYDLSGEKIPADKLANAFDLAIEALSADAVPTVIRAKTFMRKEDFDKWAEDIKKQNKNIVCISCDAEVVSADAVQGEWIDIDNYYRLATCSHCHKVTMFEKWGECIKPYDYCPNCGARMKGGAE